MKVEVNEELEKIRNYFYSFFLPIPFLVLTFILRTNQRILLWFAQTNPTESKLLWYSNAVHLLQVQHLLFLGWPKKKNLHWLFAAKHALNWPRASWFALVRVAATSSCWPCWAAFGLCLSINLRALGQMMLIDYQPSGLKAYSSREAERESSREGGRATGREIIWSIHIAFSLLGAHSLLGLTALP